MTCLNIQMDVRFSSPALAALCNSERRLADRWGAEAGRTVGRRLYELCSADATALHRLPGASVEHDGKGETVIDFGAVTIRGQISADGTSGELIVISSVDVQGSAH
jgi:hypothetical protein